MSELDEGFATDSASAELFRTCVPLATNEPYTEPKQTLNTSDDENIYATVKKMFHKVDEYKPTEEPFKGEASAEDDMLYTVQVQYAETWNSDNSPNSASFILLLRSLPEKFK